MHSLITCIISKNKSDLSMHVAYTVYVKAARPVPDGEVFTLFVWRSFMRRRPSFSVPMRYACRFISFQYIIIRVRQAKLRHYNRVSVYIGLGAILVIFLSFFY